MSLDRYIADARMLASEMPQGSPVKEAIGYLTNVASGAVAASIDSDGPYWLKGSVTKDNFAWVNSEEVSRLAPNSNVAVYAGDGVIEALVSGKQKPDQRLMMLPTYNPRTPHGNASLILHALQHADEPPEAEWNDTIFGNHERAAYGVNAALYETVDPEGFEAYVNHMPLELRVELNGKGGLTADTYLRFPSEQQNDWLPPKRSLLGRLALGDSLTARILRSTAIITSLSRQAQTNGILDNWQIDHYIGFWYRTNSTNPAVNRQPS